MNGREDERREVPDRFLRTDLAKAAARETAADGEREGDPFPGKDGRHADHDADKRAGIRPGDQAGEKRAFERQVGGIVVEQQA